jgi:hypothetical protein
LTFARTLGSVSSMQRAGSELGSSISISEGIGVVRKGRFLTPEVRHRGASHTGLWAGPGQKACLACPAGRVGRPRPVHHCVTSQGPEAKGTSGCCLLTM